MLSSVAMFPGLGAEYPGMVSRFCAHYPDALDSINYWSAATGVDLIGDSPTQPRERQRQRHLQIHIMNLLWWQKAGAKYDDAAVCGHSLGFYAALAAAGVIDLDFSVELVDLVFGLSWDAWADNGYDVVAITSRCQLDDPRRLLDIHGLETLCVNSDTQLVVYGPPEAIDGLCAELGENLLGKNPLESPIPFHSWSMRGVSATLQRLMTRDRWRFNDPVRRLWSHIHARRIPDATAAAGALADQPRLPVRWRDTIYDLRSYGATRFTEIGPNRILSQMVRWSLPRHQVECSDLLRFPGRARA